MRIGLVFLLTASLISCFAQNLVKDGSFEELTPNQNLLKSINNKDTTKWYWYGFNANPQWNPRKYHLEIDGIY